MRKRQMPQLRRRLRLLGIRPEACTGHDISAAYGVLEPEGEALNQALMETKYIPVKGELHYVSAEKKR